MTDLVRSSLRLRPDRIPVGEVRGPEALDLLKAWGTGHPGGIGTIHAGTASAALHRLEQLILEAIPHVPRPLIAETIDVTVVLNGRGSADRLSATGDRNSDVWGTSKLVGVYLGGGRMFQKKHKNKKP